MEKNISIFPNPTDGLFKVNFSDTWKGDIKFQLVDIFGRAVLGRNLNNNLGTSSHEFDISNKIDGIYIVQLICFFIILYIFDEI